MFKNREIFDKILKYIDLPEILILHGARQVGKTTLMKISVDFLSEKGINNIFFFDLERTEHLNLCNKGVDEIILYINSRKASPKDEKIYIFIDEIQYLDNPSSLLKLFYDYHKNNYKLIVSGSSSFAIKSKFKDSLVGRIIDLEIFGLSFNEFLNFKNLNYNISEDNELSNIELKKLYNEYCLYGFYPQIVLTDNLEFKELYINGIIEKYIYKDIRDLANIRDIGKFNDLLKFLASQVCSLVNLNELSGQLRISRSTIEDYLFILENTFIIKLIRPFNNNVRGELTKMPKIFFEDNGILNILRNKKLKNEIDGMLFENSIYAILRRLENVRDIHFWRTVAKQEVDFVMRKKVPQAIEVKLGYQRRIPNGVTAFWNKYNDAEISLVTLEKNNELNERGLKQLHPWQL